MACDAPDSISRLYRNDADRLAIRRVNATGSSYRDSVRINKEISTRYLLALAAVRQATHLPAVDTVTRLLDIHTYNPGLNSLVVMADSNLIWMTRLRYDMLPTFDYNIDNMMSRYGMKKVFYSGLLQPNLVVFRTETNSNLVPLAGWLKGEQGIRGAEADHLYGDGNDITDSIAGDHIQLVYSYGWQDCPTGCERRRFWKFRVMNDCSVSYSGSYGAALEPSLVVYEPDQPALFTGWRLYSNPAKSVLYLENKARNPAAPGLRIKNKKGQVVRELAAIRPGEELDLILLAGGLYSLSLYQGDQEKTWRIDKR